MSAWAEWKPKLSVMNQADVAVEALEAAVGEPEPDGGEDAVAVLAQGAGEAEERLEPRAAGPGQPGVQLRGRQARVVDVVEQPELFAQQEGAVEPPVLALDFPQRGELSDGLAFGRFQQRPAGALDPAAGRSVRALVGVSFVAADLIGRAACEPDDVERIEADLGLWGGGADRALVLAARVDRDRPDRGLARAELVEEALQFGPASCALRDREHPPHETAGSRACLIRSTDRICPGHP